MKKSYSLSSFSLVYVFLLFLLAPTFNCCESVHVWYSYHMKKLGWKFNISVKTCALRLLTKHNYLLLFFVLFGKCNISARFLLPTSRLSSAWYWNVRILTTFNWDFAFTKTLTFELSSRLRTFLIFEILIGVLAGCCFVNGQLCSLAEVTIFGNICIRLQLSNKSNCNKMEDNPWRHPSTSSSSNPRLHLAMIWSFLAGNKKRDLFKITLIPNPTS